MSDRSRPEKFRLPGEQDIVSPRDPASGLPTGKRHLADQAGLDDAVQHLSSSDKDLILHKADRFDDDGDGVKDFDFDTPVDHEGIKEVIPKLADSDYEEIAFGKIKEVAPKLVDNDYEEIAFEKLVDAGREHPGLVTELGFPALAVEDDEMVDLGGERGITWDAGTGLQADEVIDAVPKWNDGGITAEDDWETPAAAQDDGYLIITLENAAVGESDFGADKGDGFYAQIDGQSAGLMEEEGIFDSE